MKHMLELFKENRYKVISERMIEVDSQIVQQVIKKGRTVITCSCENSSNFAHSNMCRHKKFFIMLPLLEKLNKRIDTLVDYYKINRDISKDEEIEKLSGFFCSDLEELRRLE